MVVSLLFLTTSVFAADGHKNLLINGDFALDAPLSGCVAGTTSLAGWTVTTGNIDIDSDTPGCSSVPSAVGKYWIDLTGSFDAGAGTITQTVATKRGEHYRLTFYFGGNSNWQPSCLYSGYANDGPVKSMNVLISGSVPVTANYSINTTGQSCSSANWTFEGITFTATSAMTTITFQSLDSIGVYGPLLSGVSLRIARHHLPSPRPDEAQSKGDAAL
jgi:hypothetical protein